MTARIAGRVAVGVLLATVVTAAQDGLVHIYYFNGSGYSKAGTTPSGSSSNMALVCRNKNCHIREVCERCHTGSTPAGPLRDPTVHDREFRQHAVQVTDREVAFGLQTLRRDGGRLTLSQGSGGRVTVLPPDALVLPDRSGQAAFVVYKGDQAPRP